MSNEARTVSSIFANLEKLVCELAPLSGQALLGARWNFALPRPEFRGALVEYSFPLDQFVKTLESRVGLRIVEHSGADVPELYDHLDRGDAAIAVIDSFFLPYRPAFGRVHSHRTIIVRQGICDGEVWVEDIWPPRYEGPLSISELELARHSSVPLDRKLEPIYAGHPIDGEWFSIEISPIIISDAADWGASLLRTIYYEATASRADSNCFYGIAAFERLYEEMKFALECPSDERFDFTREVSLLLRAELSARVYLCALLRAAAGWLKSPHLGEQASSYYQSLRHMEMARDVLTKSLTRPRPEYNQYILNCLSQSVGAEERLATCLADFAAPIVAC